MMKRIALSPQTQRNWLIDVVVFSGALLAGLSGVYFLFAPSDGYRGGRNALYGVTYLFDRSTWDDIHTLGGVVMIAAGIIHLIVHWQWVVMVSRRVVKSLLSRGSHMSSRAKVNLTVNLVVGLSFLITAITGIYFLFAPSGGFQGGRNSSWDPGLVFSRTTWDQVHTWAGVILMLSAAVHLAIHWRWVVNVTSRLYKSWGYRPVPRQVLERRSG